MAAELRARTHDVRIIASDLTLGSRTYARRNGPNDRRAIVEDVAGVPFVWLSAGAYERNDWRRAISMLVFSWNVWVHLLRTVRPGDVVIGSSPHLLAATAARACAVVRRANFVLEVRDLWPETLTGMNGRSGALAMGLRVLADLLYRTSHAIIVLAEGNREHIVRRGARPDRITYIPNGVNVDVFTEELRELPAHLAWIESVSTFVYAGAHGPANGLDLVLRGAAELQRRGRDDIRVLLVGSGPSKDDLRREASRQGLTGVVFCDPVPKQLIPSILRRCTGGLMILKDVEVFRYGVSPNKLFDYLASGLPIITNVPGEVARTVQCGQAGIVVPPGDSVALADAMVSITDGNVPSGSGMEYVRKNHDRKVLADRLARVLDAVVQ